MKATTNAVRLGAALATVLFLSPVVAHAQEPVKATPTAPEAKVCTVALEPAALKVQAEPLQLKATLSQAIGADVTAKIQEEGSGVQVALAAAEAAPAAPAEQAKPAAPAADKPAADKPAADKPAVEKPAADPGAKAAASGQPAPSTAAAAQSIPLTVNTSAANAGEWTLALQGESGTCTGKLKVEAAPK